MEKLLCINNLQTDPYLNLAMEEFLVKNYAENIFMLWQSQDCVVVGKHQNTIAEINFPFIENHHIKVARRLSGGGTVYHDAGNLNFTFIINGSEGKLVDFGKYTSQIVEFLNNLEVPARSNARHDITINGFKISGNAEHIFKKRVLHHGTLLFNSDLERLNNSINPSSGKYIDKAVQSVRSKVCNIHPYLKKKLTISEFKEALMEYFMQKSPFSLPYIICKEEMELIKKLRDEKYASWEWIFGYSPKYEIHSQINSHMGNLQIHLSIRKGIVSESNIHGNLIDSNLINKINTELIGLKHKKDIILNLLKIKVQLSEKEGFSPEEFVNHLF